MPQINGQLLVIGTHRINFTYILAEEQKNKQKKKEQEKKEPDEEGEQELHTDVPFNRGH